MADDERAPRIALAEIAALAEVSEATVSRVMNRRYGVAAATRESVERAMRQLGYERRVNGQLVVLLSPSLVNPFFARLGDRIRSELAPYGLRTVICTVDAGTADERLEVHRLQRHDGTQPRDLAARGGRRHDRVRRESQRHQHLGRHAMGPDRQVHVTLSAQPSVCHGSR